MTYNPNENVGKLAVSEAGLVFEINRVNWYPAAGMTDEEFEFQPFHYTGINVFSGRDVVSTHPIFLTVDTAKALTESMKV